MVLAAGPVRPGFARRAGDSGGGPLKALPAGLWGRIGPRPLGCSALFPETRSMSSPPQPPASAGSTPEFAPSGLALEPQMTLCQTALPID